MEVISMRDGVRLKPCQHWFCKKDVNEWFDRHENETCPTCRQLVEEFDYMCSMTNRLWHESVFPAEILAPVEDFNEEPTPTRWALDSWSEEGVNEVSRRNGYLP